MRTHWKVYIIGLILTAVVAVIGTLQYGKTDYLRKDVSRKATLVQAYEYDDKCGHKGRYNCSAFKGRFLVEPEHVYITRPIDGFFYHNYVDKGRVDMPSYVTASKVDLGVREPKYTTIWACMKVVGIVLFIGWFFAMGIGCLFEDQEIRDRRRRGW